MAAKVSRCHDCNTDISNVVSRNERPNKHFRKKRIVNTLLLALLEGLWGYPADADTFVRVTQAGPRSGGLKGFTLGVTATHGPAGKRGFTRLIWQAKGQSQQNCIAVEKLILFSDFVSLHLYHHKHTYTHTHTHVSRHSLITSHTTASSRCVRKRTQNRD